MADEKNYDPEGIADEVEELEKDGWLEAGEGLDIESYGQSADGD